MTDLFVVSLKGFDWVFATKKSLSLCFYWVFWLGVVGLRTKAGNVFIVHT